MTSSETLTDATVRPRPLSLLLISYIAFMAIGIPDGVLGIAWTYMKDDFRVELDSLGILLGVAMIGRLLTSFASGAYIRRLGVGWFLVGGAALIVIGIIGYAIAPSWIVLLIFVAIAAMGSGAIDAGLNTVIAAGYTRGQLNWLHAAYGIGITVGPIIATFVIVTLSQSWRFGYLLSLIPLIALLVLFIATFSRWVGSIPQATVTHSSDGSHQTASLLTSLRVPTVILSGLLFFAYGGVELGAGNLANTLFVESRGATQEVSSFWISLYWGSFTIGRILMGFVADRLNVLRLLRGCMILMAVGAFMLMINPTPLIGFIGLAVMGFASAPMFATLLAETPYRVGPQHTNNTVGVQVGVVGLGGAVLPYIAGLLAPTAGLEVIGVILFIGCVIVFVLHEWTLIQSHRDRLT